MPVARPIDPVTRSGSPPSIVLFDLDGTLADTAPDLARALNRLLAEMGRAPLPLATIRPVVSRGTEALLELAFGPAGDEAARQGLRERLITLYTDAIADETRLFPGMDGLLEGLESRVIPWGVVTNKPARLTDPLMAELGLAERAACVVSGDTTAFRKPHPGPLLHACRLAGTVPAGGVYIGDAERDIAAGRAAGMATLVALFGYIGDDEDPATWRADGLVDDVDGILDWLGFGTA